MIMATGFSRPLRERRFYKLISQTHASIDRRGPVIHDRGCVFRAAQAFPADIEQLVLDASPFGDAAAHQEEEFVAKFLPRSGRSFRHVKFLKE
jgi:hypothetical protein